MYKIRKAKAENARETQGYPRETALLEREKKRAWGSVMSWQLMIFFELVLTGIEPIANHKMDVDELKVSNKPRLNLQ